MLEGQKKSSSRSTFLVIEAQQMKKGGRVIKATLSMNTMQYVAECIKVNMTTRWTISIYAHNTNMATTTSMDATHAATHHSTNGRHSHGKTHNYHCKIQCVRMFT